MKRKRNGKRTAAAAPTSSSHDGTSGKAYEVFLNFRGPDTRLTIVDCLYHALIRAGIRAFKDDEDLRVGEEIGGSLLQAINHSRIYITIFSKDYAGSKWCLRELAHIVERKRRRSKDEDEKVIFPIFYDVDADDVKLKTELYRKALQEHESQLGKDSVKPWEEALREVGKIMGRNLEDHGLYELINLTVEEASSKLWTRQSGIFNHLVGIKDRIDDIMKELDLGVSNVRSIVIHGMGGIGKTSLARVVFNQISPQFQNHCCFLKDVRSRDMLSLQKELLSGVLNLSCIIGRDIVYLESCNIHLRSRLWSPKDAFHVVQRKMGNENIMALNLGKPEPDATYKFKPKEFAVLVNLRFLHLDHGNFEGDFKDLFPELRWLLRISRSSIYTAVTGSKIFQNFQTV